jgi:hypothetical protein
VRVAVVLAAGQALLCAVIGWLTFGSGPAGSHSAQPSPPVNPLAAPPLVMPTASMVLPATRAPATTRAPRSRAAAPARSIRPGRPPAPPRAPQRSSTEPPPEVMAVPDDTPTPQPPAAAPEPDPAATPAPSGSGEVQLSRTVGDACDPPGAPGITDDNVALTCVPGSDGRPVWQIN